MHKLQLSELNYHLPKYSQGMASGVTMDNTFSPIYHRHKNIFITLDTKI